MAGKSMTQEEIDKLMGKINAQATKPLETQPTNATTVDGKKYCIRIVNPRPLPQQENPNVIRPFIKHNELIRYARDLLKLRKELNLYGDFIMPDKWLEYLYEVFSYDIYTDVIWQQQNKEVVQKFAEWLDCIYLYDSKILYIYEPK